MKIIHTADIHLGSKMDTKFNKEKADERKRELRDTFRRMVEYAKDNGVSVIMLCGDVFDSDSPFKKDKDFFYSVVKSVPDIDFLYLKGNHDNGGAIPEELPENLKLFSEQWTAYSYGNVVICGTEICPANRSSYYSSLVLDKEKCNIVMLHGDTSAEEINLKKLKNKNIDYLALGHIHKRSKGQIDERGEYVYCGCLEGRGFDEPGEHGFELLDIDGNKIKRTFIPFAKRQINEINVDITGCKNAHEASTTVTNKVRFNKEDIYRINLTGEINFDVDNFTEDVKYYLRNECYFIDIKDKTSRKIDISQYENDLSIKGEFVRTVISKKDLSMEEKMAIINCGLKALDGKEIDL